MKPDVRTSERTSAITTPRQSAPRTGLLRFHASFPAFCFRSSSSPPPPLSPLGFPPRPPTTTTAEQAIVRRFSAGELPQRTPTPFCSRACWGCAFPLRGYGAAPAVWFVSGVLRGFRCRRAHCLPDPKPLAAPFCPYVRSNTPSRWGWAVGFRFWRCGDR